MKAVAIVYVLLRDVTSFNDPTVRKEVLPKEHSVQGPLAALGLIVGSV